MLGMNASERRDVAEAEALREENRKLVQKVQKLASRVFALENPELVEHGKIVGVKKGDGYVEYFQE